MNLENLETRTYNEKEYVVFVLTKLLADTYSLMLKTQNYHWGVMGPNFYSLHKMFEEQYRELFEAADLIAERIRAIGGVGMLSVEDIINYRSIESTKKDLTSQEMLEDLKLSNLMILKNISDSQVVLREYYDEATMDLITERIRAHDRNVWFLSSSIFPII
jgi:starvation-inducible DNA-binding protein